MWASLFSVIDRVWNKRSRNLTTTKPTSVQTVLSLGGRFFTIKANVDLALFAQPVSACLSKPEGANVQQTL